jgi:peptidyl-prolyl cis-trans isomerase C
VLFLALATAGFAQAAEEKTPRTLVEVNGEPVLDTQFLVYRSQRGEGQELDNKAQVGLLNELVNTVMIAQAGKKQGLEEHPEIKAAIDVARYRILAEAAVEQHLRDNPVTDAELQAAYDERYGGDKLVEYKARHILLKTEDEAKTVIAELDEGADFATLAKEKSTGPSGPNGGDLGWFEKNQMVAPFAEAVAAMDKGSYSKTPVQTQFGWHVIKLEDTRDQTPPKLDMVRQHFIEQLQRQKVAAFIKGIRADADIKLIELQGAAKE